MSTEAGMASEVIGVGLAWMSIAGAATEVGMLACSGAMAIARETAKRFCVATGSASPVDAGFATGVPLWRGKSQRASSQRAPMLAIAFLGDQRGPSII